MAACRRKCVIGPPSGIEESSPGGRSRSCGRPQLRSRPDPGMRRRVIAPSGHLSAGKRDGSFPQRRQGGKPPLNRKLREGGPRIVQQPLAPGLRPILTMVIRPRWCGHALDPLFRNRWRASRACANDGANCPVSGPESIIEYARASISRSMSASLSRELAASMRCANDCNHSEPKVCASGEVRQ
jgi:hypothetical protein